MQPAFAPAIGCRFLSRHSASLHKCGHVLVGPISNADGACHGYVRSLCATSETPPIRLRAFTASARRLSATVPSIPHEAMHGLPARSRMARYRRFRFQADHTISSALLAMGLGCGSAIRRCELRTLLYPPPTGRSSYARYAFTRGMLFLIVTGVTGVTIGFFGVTNGLVTPVTPRFGVCRKVLGPGAPHYSWPGSERMLAVTT